MAPLVKHVLVAGKLHPLGRRILDAAHGVTVKYIDEISEASYAPFIEEADALLIRTQPMTAATVAMAQRLQIVSRHGVGYDAVDIEALNARGIPLAICGDVNSTSVAEQAAMMMLAASKLAIRADNAVRTGNWNWRNKLETQDVNGRNLLLIGFGRIGRRIASVVRGFGLQIRAYDPYLAKHGWPNSTIPPVATLDEGLAWADIISLSVPHSGEPLIGASEFRQMRDGVIVVNTARGGIVDESAMVAALQSGKVRAVGLDVFANEPVLLYEPLNQFDQAILSPHIAGLSAGAAERMAEAAARNILDFFANRLDHTLVVNREYLNG